MAKGNDKNGRVIQYSPSAPSSLSGMVPPIKLTDLDLIVAAITRCRQWAGDEGARERWDWHGLYPSAVAAIEKGEAQ